MTEQPSTYGNPSSQPENRYSLKAECHRLIEAIAKRPNAIKMLLSIRDQARVFADYKITRRYQR